MTDEYVLDDATMRELLKAVCQSMGRAGFPEEACKDFAADCDLYPSRGFMRRVDFGERPKEEQLAAARR